MTKNLILLFFLVGCLNLQAQSIRQDSLSIDTLSKSSIQSDSLSQPIPFGEREVRTAPQIVDDSQKTGIVVLRVCVNANGDVIEAEYTYEGSNTADSRLVELAINNAKKWKFKKADIERQCGTIKYDFKLKD